MEKQEKEFNLSEKVHRVRFDYDYKSAVFQSDIKEFIKRLKLEMHLTWSNNQILNKLAGEKFA